MEMRPDRREHVPTRQNQSETAVNRVSQEYHSTPTSRERGPEYTTVLRVVFCIVRFLDVKVVVMLRANRHTRIA